MVEGERRKRETKIYKVVADTRVVIHALRVHEDFEPVVYEGVLLNSSVEWLGKGSIIIIRKTPIDREKWLEYLQEHSELKTQK